MNRMGFIGGSDTIKIMQGDWLDLWRVKTGRATSEDLSDNIAVQLGIYTEPFNVMWFEDRTKNKVVDSQTVFFTEINDVPVQATIDGRVVYEQDNFDIVECKHTNAYNSMDSLLQYYMPQIQTYIHASEAKGAYLSAIFGNNKWEAAYVERNTEYFNSMWAVVSDFWGYVLRDEEPVSYEVPSLSIDAIAVDDMVKRDASTDNAFIDAANTYIENQAAAGAFEGAKKSLKEMVGNKEREVYCDLLTVKRSKNGSLRITVKEKGKASVA